MVLAHSDPPKTQQTRHQYRQGFGLAVDKINPEVLFPHAGIGLLRKLSPGVGYVAHGFLGESLRV